jgi:hypothetical protein
VSKNDTPSIHYRPDDWVEVRPFSEILATLDAKGRYEGLPFMPEMLACCGRRFQVFRRAEKVFLDREYVATRLENTVLLTAVRCDGASHDGCQMACLMLWKEAWLRPVPGEGGELVPPIPADAAAKLPTRTGDAYCCQATELSRCTTPLPWWDLRQYVRDYFARKMTVRQWCRMMGLLIWNKLCRALGATHVGMVLGTQEKPANETLGLQPGDWVRVKSRKEIEATLDTNGRNRGLSVAPEMLEFCGQRLQVVRRVETIILEWTGELRRVTNTVILDGATCSGMVRRGCPRDCYHLWREAWLERAE